MFAKDTKPAIDVTVTHVLDNLRASLLEAASLSVSQNAVMEYKYEYIFWHVAGRYLLDRISHLFATLQKQPRRNRSLQHKASRYNVTCHASYRPFAFRPRVGTDRHNLFGRVATASILAYCIGQRFRMATLVNPT